MKDLLIVLLKQVLLLQHYSLQLLVMQQLHALSDKVKAGIAKAAAELNANKGAALL